MFANKVFCPVYNPARVCPIREILLIYFVIVEQYMIFDDPVVNTNNDWTHNLHTIHVCLYPMQMQ